MIRRYTREEYTARVRRLLAARPDMTVSTDIIVGFPGESEDDFRATLDLVREIGFTGLFGFKYSPRPLTPALKLVDDVPEEEKSARLARLFEVCEAQTRSHLQSLLGSTPEVLIEGPSKAATSTTWEGRTVRNEIVHVDGRDAPGRTLTGELVTVEITSVFKHSLAGKPTEAALAALPEATSVTRAPSPHGRRARRALPLVL
jgi:tRNA-2-methylthio-N6-dimethylallyladenosine synthase